MVVVGKKVEQLIARLAQEGKSCWNTYVTGYTKTICRRNYWLIKAIISARMAFNVASSMDSKSSA